MLDDFGARRTARFIVVANPVFDLPFPGISVGPKHRISSYPWYDSGRQSAAIDPCHRVAAYPELRHVHHVLSRFV
jgi:hypothetical protein